MRISDWSSDVCSSDLLFLDDSRSPGISYELAAMERVAKARGDVIAIGHPHPTTLAALEKWIAPAKDRGFSLVPISTVLLRRQQMERRALSGVRLLRTDKPPGAALGKFPPFDPDRSE